MESQLVSQQLAGDDGLDLKLLAVLLFLLPVLRSRLLVQHYILDCCFDFCFENTCSSGLAVVTFAILDFYGF